MPSYNAQLADQQKGNQSIYRYAACTEKQTAQKQSHNDLPEQCKQYKNILVKNLAKRGNGQHMLSLTAVKYSIIYGT